MTAKQQMATGFLSMMIVGSIALMPVNAGQKATRGVIVHTPASMTATLNSTELPQDQVKDLTYN